jgi:hypothetical protein
MRSSIAPLSDESPDHSDQSEETPDRDTTEADGPYPSREITGSLDPFLTGFDTSNFRLDDRDLDRILGLLIVISSLAGGNN